MGIVTNAIVSFCYGLSANLPSTAAEIASALNIATGSVVPGMAFYCTDTGNLYVWNGSAMDSVGIQAGEVSIADLESVEGNGSKVQLTNQSSTTSGDVVTYDGNGNVQDSGTLLSSLVTSPVPNSKLANDAITINGDGTLLSSPGSTVLGGTAAFSLNSQTENTFLAAPNGSNGTPTFRTIVAADIPTLNQSTTGTAGGLSGSPNVTVNILTAAQVAMSSGDVFQWNSDTGISRISAGIVGVGDGTAGDYSGNLRAQKIYLYDAGKSQYGFEIDPTANTFGMESEIFVGWTATSAVATLDTTLSRVSAGVIGVGTGTGASTAGTLEAKAVTITDTAANTDLTVTNSTAATTSGTIYLTPALVASCQVAPSYTGSEQSESINTTGASLLVAVIGGPNASGTISDSNSNTWNYLTTYKTATSGSATYLRIAYAYNPTVGVGHYFTVGAVNTSAQIYAFSNMNTTSAVYDSTAGVQGTQAISSTSVQPGSITPTNAGELLIFGTASYNGFSSFPTVNDSFSSPVGFISPTGAYNSVSSYLMDSSSSAINPTMTCSAGGEPYAATIAAFIPAQAGTITNQSSPLQKFSGTYYNGSASATDSWSIEQVTGSNSPNAPTSTLQLTHSGTSGQIGVQLPSTSALQFSTDTGLSRISAGVLGIGNGTPGDYSGTLQCTFITGNGPQNQVYFPQITTGYPSIQFGSPNQSGAGFYTVNTGIGSGSSPGFLGLYSQSGVQFYEAGVRFGNITGSASAFIVQVASAGEYVELEGNPSTTINISSVLLTSTAAFTATSAGAQAVVEIQGDWAPTSGSSNFFGLYINPEIDQTSSATGTYSALAVYPYVASLESTITSNYLLALGTAASQAINATLTTLYTIDQQGHHVGNGNLRGQATAAASGSPTTVSVSYTNAFASTPYVVVTPLTSGVGNFYISASSSSGFTITYANGTNSAVFNWIAMG
jgi:hypothetical protein